MKKNIAVIGAGVGGLAGAARLAHDGHSVRVFEKLAHCGGRNNLLIDGGFRFDMGPSFVLMPDLFEEVFSYCGENLRDHLDLRVLDPSYKIFYPDGRTFTVHRDSRKTMEEAERLEPGAAAGFNRFMAEITGIYQKIRPMLYQSFSPADILNPRYWPLAGSIRLFESYWQLAARFFKSDRLRFAFTFEAMFMGVSPREAPAFYSIISYADHAQKIFHPMGGMYQIPLALEAMAKKNGAVFSYNTEATGIKRKNGKMRVCVSGVDMDFDQVLVNADYAYTQEGLLGRKIPEYKYSCSVYLMYLGLKRKINGLAHHNLFFSDDPDKNLREIFRQEIVPEYPSFYVHVPTVTDPSLAPEGKEIIYILIPVPNLRKRPDDRFEYRLELRDRVLGRINNALGMRVEDLIEIEHEFFPRDFIDQYNIKYGATFGLSHNLAQSAFWRPANADRRMMGLYFAGASTQPGGGLPVVIASSRIAAGLMNKNARG